MVAPDTGAGETVGGYQFTEATPPAVHRASATLVWLSPGAIVVLSFPARPVGKRGLLLELTAGAQSGGGFCDLPGGTATRERDMLDAGIEPQPDGWSRCWVAMTVGASIVDVRLTLLDERLDPAYVGTGARALSSANSSCARPRISLRRNRRPGEFQQLASRSGAAAKAGGR
jgi:hypothetical protein